MKFRLFYITILLIFSTFLFVIYPVFSETKPFVIHISKENISIGNETREQSPSRPVWWSDPEDIKYETTFSIPFSAYNAELHLEVLNVNSSKNYVKINGMTVGALYPDAGMSFTPCMIIVPIPMLKMGENTISIEAAEGIKDEEYDNFLIRNLDLYLYRPGDAPVSNGNQSVLTGESYSPEQFVTLPSLLDVAEGEEFSVKLISSSKEGYIWQIQEKNYDHNLLKLVSQNSRLYDTQGRLEEQFNFIALAPGSTQLEFRKFYTATGELAVLGAQASTVEISKLVILSGIIQRIEQPVGLGTHQLVNDTGNIICILRCSNSEIRLEDYVGSKVKLSGKVEQIVQPDNSKVLIFTVKNISVNQSN